MSFESAFTMDTSSIKFGPGVTREVGEDVKNLGVTRVMVVTDPALVDHTAVTTTVDALKAAGIDFALYSETRVEPTDISFQHAIDFATAGGFDGYVAVGGGSVIDTAKAANLYATYPADLLTYVNAPIGQAKAHSRTTQTVGRHSDHGRHRQRNHRGRDLRSHHDACQDWHRPSRACGRRWAFSIRSTRSPCRPWSRPVPRSMS